jgi:hypothetical protein
LVWHFRLSLQKQIHQQAVGRFLVQGDLLITFVVPYLGRRQFQPV